MKICFALFIPLFLLAHLKGSAQERYYIHLMNGQILPASALNDTSYTNLQITFDKNHFRRESLDLKARRRARDYFNSGITARRASGIPVVMREAYRDREEVFSITMPDGSQKLMYTYDEEAGNDLQVDAMRAFVVGRGDAYASVSGRGWLWAGLGTGLVAGYAARGSILALAVPPLFSLGTKIPIIRIPETKISNQAYRYDDDYAAGFESYARGRHFRKALTGSAMGTLIGLASFAIIDNNR